MVGVRSAARQGLIFESFLPLTATDFSGRFI
jgi:hypothetical protein